jgi:hypothetical protein
VLVPNWEKAPVGGHGKENLRRQDDVRMRVIRWERKRLRQEMQIDQPAEFQQPEKNCVVAQHCTAIRSSEGVLAKEAFLSFEVLISPS